MKFEREKSSTIIDYDQIVADSVSETAYYNK